MEEPVPSGGALPEGLLAHFAAQRDRGTGVDRAFVEPPADAVADAVVLALHEDHLATDFFAEAELETTAEFEPTVGGDTEGGR